MSESLMPCPSSTLPAARHIRIASLSNIWAQHAMWACTAYVNCFKFHRNLVLTRLLSADTQVRLSESCGRRSFVTGRLVGTLSALSGIGGSLGWDRTHPHQVLRAHLVHSPSWESAIAPRRRLRRWDRRPVGRLGRHGLEGPLVLPRLARWWCRYCSNLCLFLGALHPEDPKRPEAPIP